MQLLDEIHLDKKNRLAFGRILKGKKVSSFAVYQTTNGYLLKPKVSVPAEEAWVFNNPEVHNSLARGLNEKPAHRLGSFAHFAGDDE